MGYQPLFLCFVLSSPCLLLFPVLHILQPASSFSLLCLELFVRWVTYLLLLFSSVRCVCLSACLSDRISVLMLIQVFFSVACFSSLVTASPYLSLCSHFSAINPL
ncbi:hypothetical protein B0J12DRAFT_119405 [Macrophomina phaseolina]|uniref:Secreted peptide n=1 Tax=Macrophomina phaseolina TaxID=35725 RepID=A0ABQ8G7X4_9PEZI|nr:hypothetical protein B0J12DRAFT_119405 [Macrophomina phaseolina]